VTQYTLMGCANDVRNGGGMLPGFGFRFVADENVTNQIVQTQVPVPEPTSTPAPEPVVEETPAPAPVPASTETPVEVPTEAKTSVTDIKTIKQEIVFQFTRTDTDRPAMLRFDGNIFSEVLIGQDGVVTARTEQDFKKQ
jgi:hypothetical protein